MTLQVILDKLCIPLKKNETRFSLDDLAMNIIANDKSSKFIIHSDSKSVLLHIGKFFFD